MPKEASTRSLRERTRPDAVAALLLATLAACSGKPAAAPPPADAQALLVSAEGEARALVRVATRAELGKAADAVFADVDADLGAALRSATASATRAPAAAARRALAVARAPLVDAAYAAGTTAMLLILDRQFGGAPPTYSRHADHGWGQSDVSVLQSVGTSGATKSAGIQAQVTITQNGGGTIRELTTGSVDVDVCPDAAGNVAFRYTLHLDSRSATGGVQIDISGTGTAAVGDDAALSSWTSTVDVTFAAQGSAVSASGSSAELRRTRTVPWSAGAPAPPDATVAVVRDTTNAYVGTTLVDVTKSLPVLTEQLFLEKAQDHWQNGVCVELQVDGAADHNVVAPSSTTAFTARVHHKLEGADLPLPVQAALSGGKSLAPTARTAAPVSYGYEAPDQEGQNATVDLETRSRRGVGKRTLGFFTQRVQAWGGTLDFSGSASGAAGDSASWAGSAVVSFVRTSGGAGGDVFTADPASGSVTFTRYDSSSSTQTCSLVGTATGGAGSVLGSLTVLSAPTAEYSFGGVAMTTSGTLRCTDRATGKVTDAPFAPSTNVTSSTSPGAPGWVAVTDPKLLTGTATLTASGASFTTTWSLAAR